MKTCPRCKVEMALRNIGSVEIDECGTCKGIWFDRDELRLAKDETDPDLNWLDFDLWASQGQFAASPSELICPVCQTATKGIVYGMTQVVVDYCPQCRGTWLDKGEFAKIIDALEQELQTRPLSAYVRDALHEAREVISGPESLVSEWRGFTTVLRLMEYRFFAENPRLMDTLISVQRGSPIR